MKNTSCEIYDTALCRYASDTCAGCYMNYRPKHAGDKLKAAREFDVGVNLLPDNVDILHSSDTCLLCKKHPNPTDCYIVTDLANPEPEREKGMFFGIGKKIRCEVGSLIQMPIACCSHCKSNLKKHIYTKWLGVLLSIVLALLVFIIEPINMALLSVSTFLPVIVGAVVAAAGIAATFMLAKKIYKKAQCETEFDIFNLPILSEMQQNGWFILGNSEGDVRNDSTYIFSKTKPRPNLQFKKS